MTKRVGEQPGKHATDETSGRRRVSSQTGNTAARVVYNAGGRDFFVLANPDELSKWHSDKSVPLVDVVQSFQIFETDSGGVQGVVARPSKQTLASCFDTANEDAIIKTILTEGDVRGHMSANTRTAIYAQQR